MRGSFRQSDISRNDGLVNICIQIFFYRVYHIRGKIDGVVFTMYDSRTNLSGEVVENVKEALQERIFETLIPRNVRLAEAPSYGQPITVYDSKSAGAEAYRNLAEELITINR